MDISANCDGTFLVNARQGLHLESQTYLDLRLAAHSTRLVEPPVPAFTIIRLTISSTARRLQGIYARLVGIPSRTIVEHPPLPTVYRSSGSRSSRPGSISRSARRPATIAWARLHVQHPPWWRPLCPVVYCCRVACDLMLLIRTGRWSLAQLKGRRQDNGYRSMDREK